jgi:hypothetical protein
VTAEILLHADTLPPAVYPAACLVRCATPRCPCSRCNQRIQLIRPPQPGQFRHRAGLPHISITTPPTARKRKASEADGQLTPSEGPPLKRQTPESLPVDLPATPVTNASEKMDSDDFNSSMSGNEFDEESDMDLEDGEEHLCRSCSQH